MASCCPPPLDRDVALERLWLRLRCRLLLDLREGVLSWSGGEGDRGPPLPPLVRIMSRRDLEVDRPLLLYVPPPDDESCPPPEDS